MIESIEINLASEERQKNEALKNKKKIESELHTLETSFDQSQHLNSELKLNAKKMHNTITDLQSQLETNEQKVYNMHSKISESEFRNNQLAVELRESQRLFNNNEKLLASHQSDLTTASHHIDELTATITNLIAKNRDLESGKGQMQTEIDDALSVAKNMEDKARRAADDAARIAEELRQEQDHSSYEEQNVKSLEIYIAELENRIAFVENSNYRDEKKKVQALDAKVRIPGK